MTVPNGRRLAATDDIGVTSAEQWRGAITAPSIAIGPGRLVVVAPHPDDEVLGLGATMAARSSRKAPDLFSGRGPGETGATDTSTHDPSDVVVCVSDGAASHPGEVAPEKMRGRRKAECEAGARKLGIGLRMLGLPDGGLTAAQEVRARELMDVYDTYLVRLAGRGTGSELPNDASMLAYQIAARLPLPPAEKQALLGDVSTSERLTRLARLLRREIALLQGTRSIAVSPGTLRLATGVN